MKSKAPDDDDSPPPRRIDSRRRRLLASAGAPALGGRSACAVNLAGSDGVLLFLCGDVMTGRGIDQILPHPGAPELYESYMRSARGYVALAEGETGPLPRTSTSRSSVVPRSPSSSTSHPSRSRPTSASR